jgi:hypothetical protein
MSDEKLKKVGEKISKDVNEVLDTSGGEMPNPNRKPAENAADAAKAFETKVAGKKETQDDKIKKAG